MGCPIPARAAGPSWPPSMRASPLTSSAPPSSPASRRATRKCTPGRLPRPCAASSADIKREIRITKTRKNERTKIAKLTFVADGITIFLGYLLNFVFSFFRAFVIRIWRACEMTADIGLIGLAVMGENLVLNMESHGYVVAVFNRTLARVDEFLAKRAKGKHILGCHSVKELVAALK